MGHPEGEIEKVKSTDEEVREGVKFCDDNKYRGDIEEVKVKSPDDEESEKLKSDRLQKFSNLWFQKSKYQSKIGIDHTGLKPKISRPGTKTMNTVKFEE